MLLGVREDGDLPLVYGGEIDEKHVRAACPSIRLPGVLCMWVSGAFVRRRGGVIYNPEYY